MKNSLWGVLPLIVVGSVGSAWGQKSAPKRYNILYIMTDDHADQTISCYDGRYNRTPNIDRLAAQGVQFGASFVANSISGPSRACLLTGKHSHKNGFLDNERSSFNGDQQTFPKLLQKAGYKTAVIGKWHLATDPQGFDHWEIFPGQGSYYNPDMYGPEGKKRYPGYATDITTDKGIEWLEANKSADEPFCLLLHYKAVHRNWASDSAHLSMYEEVVFPLPETFWDDYQGRLAAGGQEMSINKDMDLANDLKMLHDSITTPYKRAYMGGELARMTPSQRAAWDAHYDPIIKEFAARYLSGELQGKALAEWKFQRYIKDYLKCVASVDDNIGRVLDYLEKAGLLDNTLVVYTSDQGFYMGEHGWFDKRFMYEESMRTPLLVRLPNAEKTAPRGVKAQGLVQNIDHAPTFLELAGVAIPSDIQGQSYWPLLRGKMPKDWRKDGLYYHFYEYPGEHQVRRHEGVRTDRYKLIHFYGHDIDAWELFDLQSDPNEVKNGYNDPKLAQVQKEMHAKLDRLKTQYDAHNIGQ